MAAPYFRQSFLPGARFGSLLSRFATLLSVLVAVTFWSPLSRADVQTLFGSSAPSNTTVSTDSQPVELGVAFQANTNGVISRVRFYREAGTASGLTVHLWSD
jgi:hypothetical protein